MAGRLWHNGPLPLEADESLYSLVAEYHLYSANTTTRRTLTSLLGRPDIQAAAEFPSGLPVLADCLQLPLSVLLEETLDLNFYRPFIHPTRYAKVYQSLYRGNGSSAQTLMALIANRLPTTPSLRYCPDCMRRDSQVLGHSFWHLHHHVPGVYVCCNHQIPLRLVTPRRRELLLPASSPHHRCYPYCEALFRIAALCEQSFASRTDHLDIQQLLITYRTRLRALGLITRNDRIRLEDWRKALTQYWRGLSRLAGFQWLFAALSDATFPQSVIYRPQASHHPLKHLMIIGHLFEDWPTFIEAYRRESQKLPAGEKQSPPNHRPAKQTEDVRLSAALTLLRQGHSLRHASRLTQIALSSLKVVAARHHLIADKRPSKIFPRMERSIWRKLMLGETTHDIARRYKISTGAVEQILRAHPYLIPARQRIRFSRKRSECRSNLLDLERRHPTWTRDRLIGASHAYTWLFKNDKEWLYAHLPPEIPRANRPPRAKK